MMRKELLTIIQDTWEQMRVRAKVIVALEPRATDVLWPLFNYDFADLESFDMSTTCLVASAARRGLYLNQRIVEDIQMSLEPCEAVGINWFWIHQMVHVTQGLSYETFRALNRNTDRMETMRADCWADFISVKVLALLDLLGHRDGDAALDRQELGDKILSIHRSTISPMIDMNPNLFIPFVREIEIKRVLSLMVYRILTERLQATKEGTLLDDSIFVNWREECGELYIWYGQTSLLGQGLRPNKKNENWPSRLG